MGSLALPAFYLPADRTGVMHAHSVVVSSLIDRATMSGIRPAARLPMLSGVLADFLEQLPELEHSRFPPRRPPSDNAAQMEEAMLGGSVAVERGEASGYPRFTYTPDGWDHSLPLMNTSSMVSELAPVVLYLRHWVRPGRVLIVEEPEAHLHPALQVEFTRQLARLVQSGVRVVITTHSDWILEELSNIVRRSELVGKQEKAKPRGDISLRPDQVGAWLFRQKKRPKGSVVEELILDDKTGL
ncbi:MAG: AAA family ATPase [Synechococcus sp. SB0666_bin_14]|nr:AAA family ATPase [Synechococcus sp. SB0666_bin_14]